MKSRNVVITLILVALAALAVWFFGFRNRQHVATKTSEARTAELPATPAAAAATPSFSSGRPGSRIWIDRDPEGPMRVEGQVLDDHDQPIGKATVTLSSIPAREVTTEADGSFAFDKLVTRSYAVSARAGDLVGGPVEVKAAAKGEPVVIHLHRGMTLAVTVLSEAMAGAPQAPLANATVELNGDDALTQTTDAAGKATFHGMEAGFVEVGARAHGFGSGTTLTMVRSGAAIVEVKLVLRHGASASGRVVDEAKHPIAGVQVVARDAGVAWNLGNNDLDSVVTNANGEFTIPALPSGSYRFHARDGEHAPGSSAIITVDGKHAAKGVEIKLVAGGVIAGSVLTADGKLATYVSVLVMPSDLGAQRGDGEVRQASTDDRGTFVVKGLMRAKLHVRASSDQAASADADVDLSTTREVRDLKLKLDITGVISGVVVDESGEPVPEAQVFATQDFMSRAGQASTTAPDGGGVASTTTDGGGAFSLHGIADGSYRVNASIVGGGRTSTTTGQGTPAKAGDTNVKVVLPKPGGIKGRIVIESNSGGATNPPSAATVSVGWTQSAQAQQGVFEVDDVAPGKHDISIRGPEFTQFDKPDITVESGKITDVGIITVKRGRQLTGHVVDSNGNGVGGAQVTVGQMLVASGGGTNDGGDGLSEILGTHSATTDDDGSFAVMGISSDERSAMAESTTGRSDAIVIAKGAEDPPPVTLTLKGFGSIAGSVTLKGAPVADAKIVARGEGAGIQATMVQTGADGTFLIDKVAAGTQHLMVMRSGAMSMNTTNADVTVIAGQQATANIAIPVGNVTLTVQVKPKAGQEVDAAQIFLFHGTVTFTTASDINHSLMGGGSGSGSGADVGGMRFWFGKTDPSFDELTSGAYSVCVIPITGNMQDPTFMQRVQAAVNDLAVYCLPTTISDSPTAQSFTAVVPAMNPLPAPAGAQK